MPFTIFCSAFGGACNLDGVGQDRANIVDASVLGRQIDSYPRTLGDTSRVNLPMSVFN